MLSFRDFCPCSARGHHLMMPEEKHAIYKGEVFDEMAARKAAGTCDQDAAHGREPY